MLRLVKTETYFLAWDEGAARPVILHETHRTLLPCFSSTKDIAKFSRKYTSRSIPDFQLFLESIPTHSKAGRPIQIILNPTALPNGNLLYLELYPDKCAQPLTDEPHP